MSLEKFQLSWQEFAASQLGSFLSNLDALLRGHDAGHNHRAVATAHLSTVSQVGNDGTDKPAMHFRDTLLLGHDGCFLNGKIRVIAIFQAKDLTYGSDQLTLVRWKGGAKPQRKSVHRPVGAKPIRPKLSPAGR